MTLSKMKVQLIAPLFVLAFAVLSEYSGLDLALARIFYDEGTRTWPLKSNFITSGILHSGGKDAVLCVMFAILGVFILSFVWGRARRMRRGAGYLILGSLLGPGIVALLKATTRIYTPWSLELFGGDKPYIRLFDHAPAGLPAGNAFPGGHSSGGFALLSVYFLLLAYNPKRRFYGLALGLGVGALFAAAQEMRGAHFLSHDLVSLVICWYSALFVYCLMLGRRGNP